MIRRLSAALAVCVLAACTEVSSTRVAHTFASRADAPVPGEQIEPQRCAYVGVFVPVRELELMAAAGGRVVTIHGAIGDAFDTGEPMLELADPVLAHARAAARAAHDGALASGHRAHGELRRARERVQLDNELAQSGALPLTELRDAEANAQRADDDLEVANASARAHRADVARLDVREGELDVRAPWPARIAARHVEPGALVSAGAPLLRIVSSAASRLRFAVDAERVADLVAGAEIHVIVDGDARAHRAVVITRSPVPDEGTHAYHLEADLVGVVASAIPGRGAWIVHDVDERECTLPALPWSDAIAHR